MTMRRQIVTVHLFPSGDDGAELAAAEQALLALEAWG
jgi:hypothetical protein